MKEILSEPRISGIRAKPAGAVPANIQILSQNGYGRRKQEAEEEREVERERREVGGG